MRRALASVPRVAWLCALVAAVNAIAWSLITPPFQVPDEQAHTYYVQQLAETGKVPRPRGEAAISPQANIVKSAGHLEDINSSPIARPAWTSAEGRGFNRDVRGASPVGGGGDVGVGSYPPLYYAALAVPYGATAAAGGSLFEQLIAMRILSALFAGGTIVFVFLFLRELLPRRPWAWTAGALACALHPLFAFDSGGVNPDSLLALFCAAAFYALARAFRHGLTARSGALFGLMLALACVTKLAALGLLPGAAAAVLLLVWRSGREGRRDALRGAGAAAAIFAAPLVLYLLLNVALWDRPLVPGAGGETTGGGGGSANGLPPRTFGGRLTYIWQMLFPRLGFMHDWHAGFLPNEIWFRGWVGRFGWGSVAFDQYVYDWARWVLVACVGLVAFSLFRMRAGLRRRLPELVAYLAIGLGLIAFYGHIGYSYLLGTGATFEQARYLFPLLALYGGLIGVAVAGLGRRWGAAVGATVVVLALGHDVAAVMLNVQRFYA